MALSRKLGDITPFGYTHVEYIHGDRIGLSAAVFSLIPALSILILIWTVLTHRSGQALIVLCLGISTEIIGSFLKNIIRQPRPAASGYVNAHYGMPSTHSFFAAAVGAYLILGLIRLPSFAAGLDVNRRLVFSLALAVGGGLICLSRIYLHYHTVEQVAVGAALGIVHGFAAFTAVGRFRLLPIADAIASAVGSLVFGRLGVSTKVRATGQRATLF